MSSTSSSSQTLSSSAALQRSNELVDLTTFTSTINSNPTSFAPLHRTVELENLYDQIDDENDKQTASSPPTTTKKVLTKCMTVIGDGSDKQI